MTPDLQPAHDGKSKPAIGDSIWRFDQNRRVYTQREPGKYSSGAPIWREHWERMEIVGETRVSWLVGYGAKGRVLHKVRKASPTLRGWAFDDAEIDRLAWVEANVYKLSRAVQDCRDYTTLQRVAEVLRFEVQT